jgi:hypothetical protein
MAHDAVCIATRAGTETDRVVRAVAHRDTSVVMTSSRRLDDDRFGTLRGTFGQVWSNGAPFKRSTRKAMATPGRSAASLTSSGNRSVVRHAWPSANQQ